MCPSVSCIFFVDVLSLVLNFCFLLLLFCLILVMDATLPTIAYAGQTISVKLNHASYGCLTRSDMPSQATVAPLCVPETRTCNNASTMLTAQTTFVECHNVLFNFSAMGGLTGVSLFLLLILSVFSTRMRRFFALLPSFHSAHAGESVYTNLG